MAKRWSANSLVAQVLLICLVGTNVEGYGQKGGESSQGPPMMKQLTQPGSQPTYPGQNPQPNFQPNVKPSYPGQNPQTNVQPGSQPTYPGYNPQPNFQPNVKPSYPGQNPQTNVQPGSQPTYPGQNPQTNFQPNVKPSYPGQNPQTNVQPGSQPTYPGQNPQTNVQPGSKPTYPGQNPQTNVQPGSQPTYPGQNPQTNFQPNVKPSYPGQNPQTNVQPGSQPTYPGQNPQTNFQPNVKPSYPEQNPQINFQPNVKPSYPGQNPQTNVQPGSQPTYPGHNPQPNFQPNVKPSYPGQNPQTNVQPGSKPTYPGQNPQTNVQPGSKPTYPGQNPQTNVQPGSKPTYPGQNPQTNVQPGSKPTYPGQNPQTNVQPGSQSSYTRFSQHIYSDYAPQTPRDPQPQTYQKQPQHPQPPSYPKQPQQPQPPTDPKQPQHQQPPTYPKQTQPPTDSKQPERTSPPDTSGVLFCEVQHHVRIQCGGHGISADGCQAIDCCFDGQQCYFGKAVTVQCTKDAQFIVVVAKDATLPNLNIETISLIGEGQDCTSVASNSEFAIFQFPVTYCGSVVTERPGVLIYENRMSSSYEVGIGPNGIITRDSSFELLFQCRYTGTSIETVVIEVLPLLEPPLSVAALGPIRVELRLANGQCSSKGCDEVDAAYTSFYTEADYPVTEVLRDPVFVEVQLLERTDPNLVLTLGRCWVTNSPNPHNLPQWDLLIDGCPYRDDRYMSSLVPVGSSSGLAFPTHCRRFIFKMFAFVDSSTLEPLREEVYIHCSTAVCTRAEGRSCEPSCFRKKREAKTTDQTMTEPKLVVTVGPVIMVDRSHSDTK